MQVYQLTPDERNPELGLVLLLIVCEKRIWIDQ